MKIAYKKMLVTKDKKIALVAHDNKKRDLIEWAKFNKVLLAHHTVFATTAMQGDEAARKPFLLELDQIALGERLVGEGTSVREAAKLLKCHHATLYRALTAAALTP